MQQEVGLNCNANDMHDTQHDTSHCPATSPAMCTAMQTIQSIKCHTATGNDNVLSIEIRTLLTPMRPLKGSCSSSE